MTAVAAIDIGTNSVRLLIADPTGDLVREATVTGLGRGVDASGRLSPEGRTATLEVLRRYRAHMDAAGVVSARAVATSASRDAADGAEFVSEMAGVLGFEPEVIPGAEEAALSYAGATADLSADDPVVVDIGGGSTEVITGAGGVSLDIGSVRVTDRYLGDRPSTSVEPARVWIRDVLREASSMAGRPVIGVAGTWTSLVALDLALEPYSDARVHRQVITRETLESWVERLAGLSIEATAQLPGLDPARAPVILGGALVAAECLDVLESGAALISTHDLLDGVVADLLGTARPLL